MATSKGNRVDPDPCGPDQLQEQFKVIREQFEQVFPKLGCATENWRMTGGVYPSHPSYPSCPTIAQLCTVAVTFQSRAYTVKLPCPRNRDPNFETGDSVLFQEDFDGNALYTGGHDDPIGTVKWFHGKVAEVPRGWYWITNSAPGSYNTRTGRYALGFGKYVKNYWDNSGGLDPALGSLGMHCNGGDAAVSVADHNFTPSVTVADHPLELTSWEYTGITIDCSNSYVSEACLEGMYGYVDIRNHDHVVAPDQLEISTYTGPGSTPVTVASANTICSETATVPPCGSPLPPVAVDIYGGCHDHYLYMNCTINDPGHDHAVEVSPHDVTVAPITLAHSVSVTQMHLPRIYMLLIERLNNSANVVGSATAAGELCTAATKP